jgi:hypothetical protein
MENLVIISDKNKSEFVYKTPQELYTDPGILDEYGVYELIGPDKRYFPDIDINNIDRDLLAKQTRLYQRIHGRSKFNSGRSSFWQLSSFWIDKSPFMIVQEAGPYGELHFDMIVTSTTFHKQAVHFLQGYQYPSYTRYVDDQAVLTNLTSFFGNTLQKIRGLLF